MRRAALVLVVLALAGLAGSAQAQSSSVQLFAFGVGGGKVLSETNLPVGVKGELVVSFRGDASAGCAAYGLCSYAGTIFVRPSGGTLAIATVRQGKRMGHVVTLVLGTGDGGYTTSARVQRSAPGGQGGTCADAQGSLLGGNAAAVTHGDSVKIRVLTRGGSLLRTRCAGPLDGDLAGAGPAVMISLARVLRGRVTLNLSGTRAFAVHGFAGTISSTLVLKLGRPSAQSPSGSNFPPGIKTQRERIVTERLSVVRVDGELSAAVRGTSDPVVCALLDTCGLSGTLTLGPGAPEINAQVIAMGPAGRPYRDFLTAVGVASGGRSRGISTAVTIDLIGHVGAAISEAGMTCTDTGGTGVVSAAVGISRPPVGGGAFASGWRTQCPGPLFGGEAAGLVASLRPGGLKRPQFTIDLRGRGSFTDDGYVISTQGEESAVVRRGRVTSQVMTFPAS